MSGWVQNSSAAVRVRERGVEEILAEDLRIARLAFESVKRTMAEALREIPSGLPHPDGTERLKNAGKKYRATMNAYASALQRFNAFVLDKTVPDDLKDSG